YEQLRLIFERCFEAGVDVAICTDNAGLHNVRLPFEYENLLTYDILNFKELQACQEAAFRHAFAWPHPQPPTLLLSNLLQRNSPQTALAGCGIQ
ncbi:MAG: adenosine deaminase, partial [Chloroflexi bacterium]